MTLANAFGVWLTRLVSFRAEANEFEEAGGGAEDDAADQTPGRYSEPLVYEPADGAKRHHGSEEGYTCGVGEAGFPVLFLILLLSHQLSRVR